YFTPIPIMWGGGASPAAFDFDLGLACLRVLGSFLGVALVQVNSGGRGRPPPIGYSIPKNCSTCLMSVVLRYGGRLSTNTFPYCFFKIRLSSSTSRPRSWSERIRRPKPCFSVITAAGT